MVVMLVPSVFAQGDLGIIGGADGPTAIFVTDGNGNGASFTIDGDENITSENKNGSVGDDPFMIRLYGGGILNMMGVSGAIGVAISVSLYILTALIAYAFGSLNFGIIISKLIYHDDIRKYGSGNAGTTNMLRTYGKGAAIATILGDALKVVFAILIGNILVGSLLYGGYVAGFFAVLGHVYPVYYKFKGGKGVVASAITILMNDWRVFLVVFGLFVIVVAIWKYISLGSILSAAIYPMVTYAASVAGGRPGGLDVVFSFVLGVFVIILHRSNIQRLLDGKENKLSFKKTDKKAVDNGDEQ